MHRNAIPARVFDVASRGYPTILAQHLNAISMTSVNPVISVIIPTFRRPGPLREAIDSVLKQSPVAVEVVVVDDCPDRSAQWLETEYAGRPVLYLANPTPSGGRPAIVRNYGWPRSKGQFLHFLDDDDIVPEGHYARVLEAFGRNPGVSVVFGTIEPFGTDPNVLKKEIAFFDLGRRRARQLRLLGSRLGFSSWLFFNNSFLVGGSSVVRRECVEAIGGQIDDIRLLEDVDFVARAIRWGGAAMIDDVSLHYRIHASLMHDASDKQARLVRGYKFMHEHYKRRYGSIEYFAMKIFARSIRGLPC